MQPIIGRQPPPPPLGQAGAAKDGVRYDQELNCWVVTWHGVRIGSHQTYERAAQHLRIQDWNEQQQRRQHREAGA